MGCLLVSAGFCMWAAQGARGGEVAGGHTAVCDGIVQGPTPGWALGDSQQYNDTLKIVLLSIAM